MKKITTLLVATFLTANLWAQSPQKMSYQAVIRDASNALVTNTTVGMKISILKGTPSGTAVYTETRNTTTNANGLLSIEIGGGSPATFTAIDWSAGPYFIFTEIDPTGGTDYTITANSQLLSVPYALYAETTANVTGLERITENGKIGWRLIGQDPNNYGDIGASAVDLSHNFNNSTTLGATGTASFTTGRRTTASGKRSTAMGNNTKAEAFSSTSIGLYNIGGGNPNIIVGTDPLFEIGNGTSSTSRSNALTVLKNGTITAPSFDISEITDNKALITKEYADTNLKLTGLEKITENAKTGWRLAGQVPEWYGNIGSYAIDLSNSFSTSTTNGATGDYSFAIGRNTIASGDYSVSMGLGTKVTTGLGIAFGKYNIGGGSTTAWVGTDPYFEIGNGVSNTSRSNAFTILKNGNTYVSGFFRASGNIWPSTGAGVELAYNSSLGIGYIQSVDRNTNPDTFHDLAVGASNLRPVTDNFTSLGTSSKRFTKVYAVNGSIQTSDRRMKKEIKTIEYGLNTIMNLHPVSYKWKQGNQDLNLGLIAQEVQKLIPEVVDIGKDKDKTLGLKYTELIPVLIKAMQEQQYEISKLKKMINKLLQEKIVVSSN